MPTCCLENLIAYQYEDKRLSIYVKLFLFHKAQVVLPKMLSFL